MKWHTYYLYSTYVSTSYWIVQRTGPVNVLKEGLVSRPQNKKRWRWFSETECCEGQKIKKYILLNEYICNHMHINVRYLEKVKLRLIDAHWWSPIISSVYGVKLDSRMLDKIIAYMYKTTANGQQTNCS